MVGKDNPRAAQVMNRLLDQAEAAQKEFHEKPEVPPIIEDVIVNSVLPVARTFEMIVSV